jgi:integrase
VRDRAITLFLQVVDGDRPLAELSLGEVRGAQKFFLEGIDPQGRQSSRIHTPATVNTYMSLLGTIWADAVKERLMPENWVRSLRDIKQQRREVATYSEAEVGRLLYHARRYAAPESAKIWETRILLAFSCALRPAEILNLKVADIDFERQRIHIRNVPASEANDEIWSFQLKDFEDRVLPMPEDLSKHLSARMAELPDRHPYLCLTKARYGRCQERRRVGSWDELHSTHPDRGFNVAFDRIAERAGIAGGRTFYTLRATRITGWLVGPPPMPPHEVQRLAGHSDIHTTMRYYAAVSDSYIAEAAVTSQNSLARMLHSAELNQQVST